MALTVGVLALQGGFAEHTRLVRAATAQLPAAVAPAEVRTPADLARCDALIIPGGESTAMALVAARSGLLDPLRHFVTVLRKPTWGTCAGLILLAESANAAKGGQDLVGGLAVRVYRNYFGRQTESFEAPLALPFLGRGAAPFPGVFIRAPVVEAVLDPDAVEVLATLPGAETDVVAVRQANVLGTSFHPELTADVRIHVWWLREMVLPRAA